jgi:plasmid stabilization system protein ParE
MFEVCLTDTAIEDLDEVCNYYGTISEVAKNNFINNFDATTQLLEDYPFFQIRYANFRLKQIEGFPYLIHYIVYEVSKTIIIYGIRLADRDPKTSYLKE